MLCFVNMGKYRKGFLYDMAMGLAFVFGDCGKS
jgi:hypothetical protein